MGITFGKCDGAAAQRQDSQPRLRGATIACLSALVVLSGCAITPQPFAASEQKLIAAADRKAAQTGVEPLTAKLTLADALARALKYNLDHRTRMMEEALAVGQLNLSRYDMLPKLTAAAGYSSRDSDRITRSKDSVTGQPSLANPYISSDRDHTTSDLGLSWNVLDFGVSYYNAKQNADRVLVAAERRRKAMHNLMQDVRTAYWRAASAQKIDAELRATLRLAEEALSDSRKVESEKLRDPLEALRYQRTLLENLRILESIQRELAASRIELAALINLPPGASFELAEPQAADLTPPKASLSVDRMEELAISNNADLKEQFYNARIAVAETKRSLLRLFPNLSFNYGYKHDSDSYLINQSWQEAGLQLSWNLFSVLSAPAVMRYSEANEKLAEQRRMTAQMAVLTQVHLSRQQYESAYVLFERADAIWQVDQRIYEHSANREAVEMKGRLDKISNNTSAIVSYLRRFRALSQVYAASSKVQATLGLEPRIGDLQEIPLADLSRRIDTDMRKTDWSEGVREVAAAQPAAVVAPVAVAVAAPAAEPVREPAGEPVGAAAVPPATIAVKDANVIAAPSAAQPPGAAVAAKPVRVHLVAFSVPTRGPSLNWERTANTDLSLSTQPGEADVNASGRLMLGRPDAAGQRTAIVEWRILDGEGKPLKTLRYDGQVSKPATSEEWQALKTGALDAMAKGLAQ
jgi:outer membrane protein TolC